MKLAYIPDYELLQFQKAGYHIVWLMGVWKLGPYGLNRDRTDPDLLKGYDTTLPDWTEADVLGSPYAVMEYTVHPDIGTEADLLEFRDRLHALGIQLFLDIVPNHSATDMPLVSSHPEYYVRAPPTVEPPYDSNLYLENGVAYGKDPYSGAWIDTAQYNIWEPKMREQLINFIRKAAQFADGVRCDMAMLELTDVFGETWNTQLAAWGYERPETEFWKEATDTLKREHPGFQFLAEVYWGKEKELVQLGFDYMYDKDGLFEKLKEGHLDNLREYITSTDFSTMAHFTENHDEARGIQTFGSVPRCNAAAVVSMTLPGMRFYWMGQQEGKANKLDVHLRRSANETLRRDVQIFYHRLQECLKDPVFTTGTWTYITPSDVDGSAWRFLSWKWKEDKNKRLVIVNYSDQVATARFPLPDAGEKAVGDTVAVMEELSQALSTESVSDVSTQGLTVTLQPFEARILNY